MQVLAAVVTFGESRPICLSWEHPVISEKRVQWGGPVGMVRALGSCGLGLGCCSSDVWLPAGKGEASGGVS